MHGRPLRRTLRLPLEVVMSWAYPSPPPQEETANNIRGQLRSRDGILTDLKALRWESLSDGWNTTGPISLRRGSRNQWRSDGGRGGSRKKPDKLFLFKRSKKKNQAKIGTKNMFLERVQRKTVEHSSLPLTAARKPVRNYVCPPACVRWAALHAGRTHQSVKAGLWRGVEKQPGHKLVRLICIRCGRRETPLFLFHFIQPFSTVLPRTSVSVCDTHGGQFASYATWSTLQV